MAVHDQVITKKYALYHGDCVEVMQSMPDACVHMSVYSPPFGGLYHYSSSDRDLSNCDDYDTFFEQYGYCVKELHRIILNSATYKQTSERSQEKDAIDPDNLLLARTSIRRIDAETLRDSMLVASGKLNRKMFGSPVPVTIDLDGQVIVGVDTTDTAGRPSGKMIPLNGEEFRRSVYVQMRRNRPLGMLETFDLPKMEPNCEARAASTVAPQSLALMNSAFSLQQAELFADRILSEAGSDPSAQIRQAWRIALQTEPTTEQFENASRFLKTQTTTLQASTSAATAAPRGPWHPS